MWGIERKGRGGEGRVVVNLTLENSMFCLLGCKLLKLCTLLAVYLFQTDSQCQSPGKITDCLDAMPLC